MLVIIEGADGTGKTTLVEKLRSEGYVSVCIPKNTPCIFGVYKQLIYNSKATDFVIDRSFITDIVYRLVLDGQPSFNLNAIACLLSEDMKIIYCTNDNSFNYAKERGEDLICERETHNKICKVYEYVMKCISIFANKKILKYDFEKMNFEDVLKFIKQEEEVI